jgi:hypothetical protein
METTFRVWDPVTRNDIQKHCKFNIARHSQAVICLLYDFPPTTTYNFIEDSNGKLKGTPGAINEKEANRKIGYSGIIALK